APRAKAAAHGLELGADGLEVVDLAVEDDADGAVVAVHRLVAGREVDDGEPAVPEADARAEMKAVAVGAAMGEDVVHPPHQPAVDRPAALQIDDARQPAHDGTS